MSVEIGPIPTDSYVTSKNFSDAIHALFGDGITNYAKQFSVTVGGFTAILHSGYIMSNGNFVWLEKDETELLDIQTPSLNKDRTDAIVCHVNYVERKANLQIMVDVNESEIRNKLSLIRGDDQYNCIMYFISVKRGATSISSSDIKDVRSDSKLCGYIKPLKNLVGDVLTVHKYFVETIVKNFSNLYAMRDKYNSNLDDAIDKMKYSINSSLDELEDKAKQYGNIIHIGDIMTSLQHPTPENEWLLCNGGSIPSKYSALYSLMSGKLPNIPTINSIFNTYIYGGAPAEV